MTDINGAPMNREHGCHYGCISGDGSLPVAS
jgi:hypothetical protein